MTISYFVFLLKHPLCLPSSSHLVYHLAFYSTGESSKNRSTSTLSYKQSHYASGPMLPSCPHFQMMNFPCGKIWRTSLFVCWIPVLLVCSGIFLEFALLISLHNHCFSSQFIFTITHIFIFKLSFDPDPPTNTIQSICFLHKNLLKEFSILIVYVPFLTLS